MTHWRCRKPSPLSARTCGMRSPSSRRNRTCHRIRPKLNRQSRTPMTHLQHPLRLLLALPARLEEPESPVFSAQHWSIHQRPGGEIALPGPYSSVLAVSRPRGKLLMQMKHFTSDKRGRAVARQMGWPRRYMGWRGAIGGLLDPFAPFRTPRSYRTILRRQDSHREQATVECVEASVRRLTESN